MISTVLYLSHNDFLLECLIYIVDLGTWHYANYFPHVSKRCTNYTNKNNKSYQEYRKFVTTENSKINKQRITGTAIGQWSTRHNLSGLSCYQDNPGSNPTMGGKEMSKIHTVDGLKPWNTLFQCIYGILCVYYNLKNKLINFLQPRVTRQTMI